MTGEGNTPPRVWEQYLSDQDRAHMATRTATSLRPLGSKPVLLIIDMYLWAFGDRPEPLLEAVQRWPGSCGLAAWEALPHCQKLLEHARKLDVPVIHVTGQPGFPRGHWTVDRAPDTLAAPRDEDLADRMEHAWEIVEQLKPIDGEMVIRKTAASAFWGTPLAGHLNYLGADTVIAIGESTSGCVRASVVDGCAYRLNMAVVEECVFDRHQAPHALSLFDMSQKYARLLNLDETMAYLSTTQSNPGN